MQVLLKPRRAQPFFGRHPWVFAGAIDRVEGAPADGDAVQLTSYEGRFVAWGLFNPHSNIRVRLYSWKLEDAIDDAFWDRRIDQAVRLRHDVLGWNDPEGACRLVYSEADGLSGLIVDRYARWLAVQFTSLAVARRRDLLLELLVNKLKPEGIYLRTERGILEAEGLELQDGPVQGKLPDGPMFVVEHGIRYGVDWREGQKTGFYLDQRENRAAVARYLRGRRVLDVFCYSGGFSLAAAILGHAASVHGVDVSEAGIRLARANTELNGARNLRFEAGDAFETLQQLAATGEKFGAVILDPPKFARTGRAVENAIKGHERLTRLALNVLEPDGILVTCSCSGHVSRETFQGVLQKVAQECDRDVQILESRGQAADHPVLVTCPESNYLQCLICRVM